MIIFLITLSSIILILLLTLLIESIICFYLKILTKQTNLKYTFIVSLLFLILTVSSIFITVLFCSINIHNSMYNTVTYLIFNVFSTLKFLRTNFIIITLIAIITFLIQTLLFYIIKIKKYEIPQENLLGQNEEKGLAVYKKEKLKIIDLILTCFLTNYTILIISFIFFKIGEILSLLILK